MNLSVKIIILFGSSLYFSSSPSRMFIFCPPPACFLTLPYEIRMIFFNFNDFKFKYFILLTSLPFLTKTIYLKAKILMIFLK
jgi:hypothetical protein